MIQGKLVAKSSQVILHSSHLKISSAKINGHDASITIDNEIQQITLQLGQDITDYQIRLDIAYSGFITERMEGIYPSSYEENGEKKVIISTQFESTHAREAFPCIDEPAAKATFDVKLESPKRLSTVLGNTPIAHQSVKKNRLETRFETSPVMSSYLLAFAIGDLSVLSGKTNKGTEVNVFATHQNADRLLFSLDVGIRCLEFYEDYFGIDYPLPKLDMIAIPEFASGAMENWGLVTYRETAMLFDETDSSLPTKRRVIEVIAHELAHQWFGNLVTMQWWDDLWLNESFATFMASECEDALFPNLGFSEMFLESEVFTALHADANSKTTSIYAELEDPRDINEHFDPAITYSKGASVLRMLHNFIGEKAFKAGLRNYLEANKYDNAVGDDLWQALNKASNKPVDEFMNVWIHKPGYPLITVEKNTLSQSRFYLNPNEREQNSDQTLWPLSIKSKSDDIYFDTKSTNFTNNNQLLNSGKYGVYRIKYPESALSKFSGQVRNFDIDDVDAMGLLDDVFALVRAGLVSTDVGLDLAKSFGARTNNEVWNVVATGVGSVQAVFESDSIRNQFDQYIQQLIDTQYVRLGWEASEGESPFDTLLRPIIIGMAARYRHPDAITVAHNLFEDFLSKDTFIDPNLRAIVYSAAARVGGSEVFDKLLELHNETTAAEEKRRLANALCSFEDTTQIKRAIDLIRTDKVRIQEAISWVFVLYTNRHARDLIWEWEKENWDWIIELFSGGHLYSYFVMGLASFSDIDKADEIERFFADQDLTGIKRSLEQSLEQIRTKAAWKQRDESAVRKYLDNI